MTKAKVNHITLSTDFLGLEPTQFHAKNHTAFIIEIVLRCVYGRFRSSHDYSHDHKNVRLSIRNVAAIPPETMPIT